MTYTGQGYLACVCLKNKLAGSAQPDLIVAIAAIHRPIFAGLEWYLSSFPTLGTYRRKHFALRPVAIAIIPIAVATVATVAVLPCFPFLAAWGTALRLVSIASGCELFLFPNAKGKGSPTIETLDRLVLETHWMTSSLWNFSWSLGHPTLKLICEDSKKLCNNLNWNYWVHYTLKRPTLQVNR